MSILVRVLRPYKYGTFLSCVLGAVIGGIPIADAGSFLVQLLLFFISFAVLSYSGLYLLNDIADLRWDRLHPQKKGRLIASGALSVRGAALIAITLLGLGLILGAVSDPRLPSIIAVFALLNILYSFVLKHVPYVDLFVNTLTHPLRVVAGIVLFGSLSSQHLPIILASAAFYFGTNAIKRHAELINRETEFRPVLKHYRPLFLAVCSWTAVLVLGSMAMIAPASLDLGLICFALVLYAIIAIGYWSGRDSMRGTIVFFLRQ